MKVVVLGAGGRAGSRIVLELAQREHEILALSRTLGKVPNVDNVTVGRIDVRDISVLTDVLRGFDAVINATKFKDIDTQGLVNAVEDSGVRRFISVGGAGSLWATPGVKEMDRPDFPDTVRPEAFAGATLLAQMRGSSLEWTYISPSRIFEPGARTGKFRYGRESLLFDKNGASAISMEDYAIALVDELEQPRYVRRRFTVGY